MGQAKQRGTFDERKAVAVERGSRELMLKTEIARRRPSPKHVAMMGMIAAMMLGHNARVQAAAEGGRACNDLLGAVSPAPTFGERYE